MSGSCWSSNSSTASIVILPYVKSLEGNIFGTVSGTADSGNDAFEATTALGASFKATDAKGDVIENNDGIARSEIGADHSYRLLG